MVTAKPKLIARTPNCGVPDALLRRTVSWADPGPEMVKLSLMAGRAVPSTMVPLLAAPVKTIVFDGSVEALALVMAWRRLFTPRLSPSVSTVKVASKQRVSRHSRSRR